MFSYQVKGSYKWRFYHCIKYIYERHSTVFFSDKWSYLYKLHLVNSELHLRSYLYCIIQGSVIFHSGNISKQNYNTNADLGFFYYMKYYINFEFIFQRDKLFRLNISDDFV